MVQSCRRTPEAHSSTEYYRNLEANIPQVLEDNSQEQRKSISSSRNKLQTYSFVLCKREHYKPLLLNSSGVTKLLIQAKRQTTADNTALGAALHTEWRTILKGRGEAFHLKEYATTHSHVCTTLQSYRRLEHRASWYIKCSNTLMPMS